MMYADDLVFLAENALKAQKWLKILAKYVKGKGLSVNISKTQLVICKPGRPKNVSTPLVLDGKPIETVPSYTYLGVEISSSALGLVATRSAIQKARIACSTALSILIKVRSDCFESNRKIFQSIVVSTLLYGAPAWALRYIHLLEPIQSYFFKRMFRLTTCTPAYLLRLELNLPPLEITVFALTLGWIVKVLKMDQSRLPRICLMREIQIFMKRDKFMTLKAKKRFGKFNWVWQVNDLLEKIDEEKMWCNLEASHWESRRGNLIEKLSVFWREKDLQSYHASINLQLKISRSMEIREFSYLHSRIPWAHACALIQSRLANSR